MYLLYALVQQRILAPVVFDIVVWFHNRNISKQSKKDGTFSSIWI